MSSKEQILSRLRAVKREPVALPDVPIYESPIVDIVGTFQTALERMGGGWWDVPPGTSLVDAIADRFPAVTVIASASPEVPGNRNLAMVTSPRDLHDVDVGIVRAAFGVAETGSVWLSEREYHVNALGYLAQHLIVLLDTRDIIPNLHHAYHRPEFFEVDFAALVSGPSATADIEGVLVRGAQGVRSLTLIPWDKP